jgi:hypothetical protein
MTFQWNCKLGELELKILMNRVAGKNGLEKMSLYGHAVPTGDIRQKYKMLAK